MNTSFEHLELAVSEIEEGFEKLQEIEIQIAEHIRHSTEHSQTAYILFATIRHNHLYRFAVNVDGSPILNWEEYVRSAVFRFGISRSWAYTATRLFRLGLLLGFDEKELLDIEMSTLNEASKVLQYTRRGRLPSDLAEKEFPIEIINEKNIGIEADWTVDEKKERLKEFVTELNVLPPDERRKHVADDILEKIRYFYFLDDGFNVWYCTNKDLEKKLLKYADNVVIENFKKRIGDTNGLD